MAEIGADYLGGGRKVPTGHGARGKRPAERRPTLAVWIIQATERQPRAARLGASAARSRTCPNLGETERRAWRAGWRLGHEEAQAWRAQWEAGVRAYGRGAPRRAA
jgi:hypothetical protein